MALCIRLPAILAHRVATHLEAVGVVNQPVPSAKVGSPICSCQRETGSREVKIVERILYSAPRMSSRGGGGGDGGGSAECTVSSEFFKIDFTL